jgi:hypothetical protein
MASVRRLCAALVLVVFASLNAMDGVCCPDGCRNERGSPSERHDLQSADGLCVLCTGSVDAPVDRVFPACGLVADRLSPPPATRYLDAPSIPLERPPRL